MFLVEKEVKISKANLLENLLASPGLASDSCSKTGTCNILPEITVAIEPYPPLLKIMSGAMKKICQNAWKVPNGILNKTSMMFSSIFFNHKAL